MNIEMNPKKTHWDGKKIPPLSQAEMIKKYAPTEIQASPQKREPKMTEKKIHEIENSINHTDPQLEQVTEDLYEKIEKKYDENLDNDITRLSNNLGQSVEKSYEKPYFANEHREGIYSAENIALFTAEDILALEQDVFENGTENDISRFKEIIAEKKITQMDKLEYDARQAFQNMIREKDSEERFVLKSLWLEKRNAVMAYENSQKVINMENTSDTHQSDNNNEQAA